MVEQNLYIVILMSVFLQCHAVAPKFGIINDLHYDKTYSTTYESCNMDLSSDQRKTFGNYECDSPLPLIESAIDAFRDKYIYPEFLIWLGDTIHHPKDYDKSVVTSTEYVLEIAQEMTDLFINKVTNVYGAPVYPVLGNHDSFPKNYLPGKPDPLYEKYADMWSVWLNGSDTAMDTFKQGGYYSIKADEENKLRVMVLNTNLYYKSNTEINPTDEDPAGQFAWMRDQFAEARAQSAIFHVMAHIAPGMLETTKDSCWFHPTFNAKFLEILQNNYDVIAAVHSAHAHTDSFKVIYNKEETEPLTTVLVAPSVTPWRWRGGVNNMARNPAIRSIQYTSGQILDVETFYLDLPKANQDGIASWSALYSFRTAYGVTGVNAYTLDQLIQEFKGYGNSKFHMYYDFNSVNIKEGYVACDSQCKAEHLCALEYVGIDRYNLCMAGAGIQPKHSILIISLCYIVKMLLTG